MTSQKTGTANQWILRVVALASLATVSPVALAQAAMVTFDLEDVWLLPDITHPWEGARQMTGTFEWTYEEGDFENGSGRFIELSTPWYNPGIENLNITVELTSIEFSLIGKWHDLGLDMTLFLLEPLSPDQPATIDTVRSIFEIQQGVVRKGHVVSGSVVPVTNVRLPEDFAVVFGAFQTGTVEDLYDSDDTWVVIQQRPAFSVLLPLIRLDVSGGVGSETASELTVTLEASTTALPSQPPQRLSLFDYAGSVWEIVDERLATTDDSVVTVTMNTNPSRFIEQSSTAVQMRIDWFDPGNVFSPAWTTRTDQAIWSITP